MGNSTSYKCTVCGWKDGQSAYCVKCAEKEEQERAREHEAQERELAAKREREAREHAERMAKMRAEAERKRRAHETQIKRMEEEAKKRERKAQEADKKAEHERKMAAEAAKHQNEKEILQKKQEAEEKEREERRQMKDKMISEMQAEVDKYQGEMKKLDASIKSNEEARKKKQNEVSKIEEELKTFDEKSAEELREVERNTQVEKLKKDFDDCDKAIKAAIEKTSVDEDNVGKFLRLTDGLTAATMSNQSTADKLDAAMAAIAVLISREGSGNLSMESYFEAKKKDRLIPILAEAGVETLEDLACDDDADGNESYKEILEAIADALEEQEQKKLKLAEKKFLKETCFKPEKWQQEAKDKVRLMKQRLNKSSPLLQVFFDRIFVGMKQAQAVLAYGDDLNDEQMKAIENISLDESNESDESDKKDGANAQEDNKENEAILPVALAPEANKCMKLSKAAIVSIDVIGSMTDEFGKVNDQEAGSLAVSVQSNCTDIVKAQADIRKSIVLAKAILDLKPAALSDESKPLWDAVDAGIIQIFQNFLEMNKASANYHAFFLRFKQSFGYYLSAPEDVSLLVSTEHLRKDIQDFSKFSQEFKQIVEKLRNHAEECIKNCVTKHIGAEAFEKNAKERSEKYQAWVQARKKCDDKKQSLRQEKSELFIEKRKLQNDIKTFDYLLQSLQSEKDTQHKFLTETQKAIADVRNTMI